MKLVVSVKNKGIILKGTTEKIEGQEEGIVRNFLSSLRNYGLALMRNVLTSLAKRFLITLGLTAAASGTAAVTRKKIHSSGTHESGTTTLISTNGRYHENS